MLEEMLNKKRAQLEKLLSVKKDNKDVFDALETILLDIKNNLKYNLADAVLNNKVEKVNELKASVETLNRIINFIRGINDQAVKNVDKLIERSKRYGKNN